MPNKSHHLKTNHLQFRS